VCVCVYVVSLQVACIEQFYVIYSKRRNGTSYVEVVMSVFVSVRP